MVSSTRCKHCGVRIRGSTFFCRTHKYDRKRGACRAMAEAILVDTAGDAWWAWDRIGRVLAGPEVSRDAVWIALGQE